MNILGRQFYKCGKPQGQGCNYFMWADDVENNTPLPSQGFDNGGRSNGVLVTSSFLPRPSWGMQGKCWVQSRLFIAMVFILWYHWAQQLPWDVPPDASFLCDKAVVFTEKIKRRLFVKDIYYEGNFFCLVLVLVMFVEQSLFFHQWVKSHSETTYSKYSSCAAPFYFYITVMLLDIGNWLCVWVF
jgi:hypothetical protein